jgi:N-acetylglucosaminyl-diphospho-decaprenol L-rhamnosyltransferase
MPGSARKARLAGPDAVTATEAPRPTYRQPGTPTVSVIIVTYRSAAIIGRCLRSVDSAAPGIDVETIVVDNASGDGTSEAARRAAPGATVLAQSRNGGFAAGCAAGASVARGSWLLFLNPDAVLGSGAVAALLDCAADHPRAGIIGGRFVHEDGSTDPRSWWGRPGLWSLCCFALGLNSLLPGNRLLDPEAPRPWHPDFAEVRPAPVVSGALMLVTRELWDRLGGFDRRYFLYAEDADFCLRAARAGATPLVTAQAVCVHFGGKSSTGLQKMMLLFTGKATLIQRQMPRGLRTAGVGLLLAGVFVRAQASRWAGRLVTVQRQRRPVAAGDLWQRLWADRDAWRHGWRPVDGEAQARLLSSRCQAE